VKHGTGKYYDENGKLSYIGEWKNDNQHGQGKYIYEDDTFYEGEFKDNNFNGQGTMLYSDGICSHYEGEWENDMQHGQGTMFYSDGRRSRYEGEWKNHKRHGQGTMFYSDGSRYEGEWKKAERHGRGTIFNADGKGEESYWLNGDKIDETTIKDSARDVDDRIKKLIQKLYVNQSTKETCAICFDEIEHTSFEIRKCGHLFHDNCWTEYKMFKFLANNDDAICPCCRD